MSSDSVPLNVERPFMTEKLTACPSRVKFSTGIPFAIWSGES